MIEIYTDGAASGNPGPGGYGAILRAGKHYKELSGGFRMTTNNRMELLAVVKALQALKAPSNVTIWSDSKYVVDSVEKKWVFGWVQKGFKDKKNKDLWIEYLKLHKIHNIKFIWIKGHNDHPENERCDQLAVAASKNKAALEVDYFFENEQSERKV